MILGNWRISIGIKAERYSVISIQYSVISKQ